VTESIIEGLRTVPIFATLDDDAIARTAAIAAACPAPACS
jgi:hypothetical protein